MTLSARYPRSVPSLVLAALSAVSWGQTTDDNNIAGTNGWPVNTPAYMRVIEAQSTDSNLPLWLIFPAANGPGTLTSISQTFGGIYKTHSVTLSGGSFSDVDITDTLIIGGTPSSRPGPNASELQIDVLSLFASWQSTQSGLNGFGKFVIRVGTSHNGVPFQSQDYPFTIRALASSIGGYGTSTSNSSPPPPSGSGGDPTGTAWDQFWERLFKPSTGSIEAFMDAANAFGEWGPFELIGVIQQASDDFATTEGWVDNETGDMPLQIKIAPGANPVNTAIPFGAVQWLIDPFRMVCMAILYVSFIFWAIESAKAIWDGSQNVRIWVGVRKTDLFALVKADADDKPDDDQDHRFRRVAGG